jgi:hypothetical protein
MSFLAATLTFFLAHPELTIPLVGAILNVALPALKQERLAAFTSAMLPDLGKAMAAWKSKK